MAQAKETLEIRSLVFPALGLTLNPHGNNRYNSTNSPLKFSHQWASQNSLSSLFQAPRCIGVIYGNIGRLQCPLATLMRSCRAHSITSRSSWREKRGSGLQLRNTGMSLSCSDLKWFETLLSCHVTDANVGEPRSSNVSHNVAKVIWITST